jgi:hypothetical protein
MLTPTLHPSYSSLPLICPASADKLTGIQRDLITDTAPPIKEVKKLAQVTGQDPVTTHPLDFELWSLLI